MDLSNSKLWLFFDKNKQKWSAATEVIVQESGTSGLTENYKRVRDIIVTDFSVTESQTTVISQHNSCQKLSEVLDKILL